MQDRILTIEERFFIKLARRERELEISYEEYTLSFAEFRLRARCYQTIRGWVGEGVSTEKIVILGVPTQVHFGTAWERSEWDVIERYWGEATAEYNLEVARLLQYQREKATWQRSKN